MIHISVLYGEIIASPRKYCSNVSARCVVDTYYSTFTLRVLRPWTQIVTNNPVHGIHLICTKRTCCRVFVISRFCLSRCTQTPLVTATFLVKKCWSEWAHSYGRSLYTKKLPQKNFIFFFNFFFSVLFLSFFCLSRPRRLNAVCCRRRRRSTPVVKNF